MEITIKGTEAEIIAFGKKLARIERLDAKRSFGASPQVLAFIKADNMIGAIKQHRSEGGLTPDGITRIGLKDSKDFCEKIRAQLRGVRDANARPTENPTWAPNPMAAR